MVKIISLSALDSSKIMADKAELREYKPFWSYVFIPLKYNEKEIIIQMEGNLKLFKHCSTNKDNYSIGLSVNDENRKIFEEMEKRIRLLTEERRKKIKNLNLNYGSFHLEDLKIIKDSQNGKFPKLYSKLYTKTENAKTENEKEVIIAPFWEVIEKKNGKKYKKRLDPLSILGEPVKGSIIVTLKEVYLGNLKSIRFIVEEVLITERIKNKSYYSEFEELEDENEIASENEDE